LKRVRQRAAFSGRVLPVLPAAVTRYPRRFFAFCFTGGIPGRGMIFATIHGFPFSHSIRVSMFRLGMELFCTFFVFLYMQGSTETEVYEQLY
jgi:hypothetical protein